MKEKMDYSKLSKEELIELLSKKKVNSNAKFNVGSLVGLEAELMVNGIPLPVKLGSIMVDKRSAAVMFNVVDTLFGVYKVKKDIATLLADLVVDKKSETRKILADAVLNRERVRTLMKKDSLSFDEAYEKICGNEDK